MAKYTIQMEILVQEQQSTGILHMMGSAYHLSKLILNMEQESVRHTETQRTTGTAVQQMES